ncbi:MAG TPA: hypothetical protein VN426_17770 [Syntrophomonadaceae bacterium]|nr:hypothetical protein [Syntrophomonadaceae bacterium]
MHRDRRIIETVDQYKALDRNQIECLIFPVTPSNPITQGKRKSQEVMLRLFNNKKLNRCRVGESDYIYYLGDKPGMIKHLVDLNWIRMWLPFTLPSWEIMHSWSYEQDYKILRGDGFAAIKNGMTGKFRFVFIEMDRGTNAFDKAAKYNKLNESSGYSRWWWVPLTERFPPILVVTVSEARKRLALAEIEDHNSSGLEFEVKMLDEIREEVMKKCLVTRGRID